MEKPNNKKPIKILKKSAGSVWFQFYKKKTYKIEPNRTQTEKNESNRANRFEPVFILKNRIETGRFELVSVFLKKQIWFDYFFFDKNRIEPKIIASKYASVREIKADKQCANLGYAREISSQNHALN